MLLKKLFRTARNYRSQFISMIIMIAVGVGIFLGFNLEWKSLEEDAFGFLDDTAYADYRIYSETGFSEETFRAIRNIKGVDAATRYFYGNVGLKGTKKSVALNVSENYTVSTMSVVSGADYDENSDGFWLSDKFADANNIKIGDSITLTYTELELTGEVIGLVKSGENMICIADENQLMPDYNSFGFVYITPKTLKSALGTDFYPQINLRSDLDKEDLAKEIKNVTGTTFLVTAKTEHTSYAGVLGESEEGKTMGAILPVLFLAIAVLTMVTTMQRIAANEKIQIGTLKALGFRDRTILLHYTSYRLVIGLIGSILGILLGYLIAVLIISPKGMMSTYIDIPSWKLIMPGFCIPVMVMILLFLTMICYLSVKKILKGSAADTLRPYTPKTVRKTVLEKTALREKLSFGTKWNLRDILRHKSRSAMTLLGVIGCTVLLVGSFGMRDTMQEFLDLMDREICNYKTKLILTETAENADSEELASRLNGDWQASSGISYNGKTVSLDIYNTENEKVRFLTEQNKPTQLGDHGVYLCIRLKDTAKIGDTIEFSPLRK